MTEFKRYAHNPPHLIADEQMYLITASTLYRKPYLRSATVKRSLLSMMADFLSRKRWKLDHWIILDTHYHFTAQSKMGCDLGLMMGNIHRKSAKQVRSDNDAEIEKKVWHNCWDRCVRDEKDYYCCLNYIYWNPVKHGYVADPLEYEWSSFYWQYKQGIEVANWEFLQTQLSDPDSRG